MFKLNQSTTYTWPVVVLVPTNGGQQDKQTFDGEFRRLSQTRLQELQTQITDGTIKDADFVREVLIGWKGITNDGGDVPFSEDALAQLLDVPGVAAAVVMSFVESLTGLKRKN